MHRLKQNQSLKNCHNALSFSASHIAEPFISGAGSQTLPQGNKSVTQNNNKIYATAFQSPDFHLK